ncbi:MAG: prepilin-type N-terminal cleavage/methylation domain-containing protein [Phycisphaerae bacterium]|nr:prepilin-type N-terminal cleavage/methylation domain-containing protein [Phycisphaerae bacterium]
MMKSSFQRSAIGGQGSAMRGGFTLIELMVVVGIIVLLVSLTGPAIGPMLSSNEESQAVSTINGLLTAAQATAQATGLPVAIRFERAYKVNDHGLMVDVAGQDRTNSGFQGVVWLDHQRARILTYAPLKDAAFRHDPQSKVFNLPRGFWVAPSSALSLVSLAGSKLSYIPAALGAPSPPVPYNSIETFFVVIGSNGELTRFKASDNSYADMTQPYIEAGTGYIWARYVTHPMESARSLLLYDRKKWESIPSEDSQARVAFLRDSARVLFVNRATGTLVEGAQP